ncbi:MAG: hypothetical protein ACXAEF_05915 [Candidatus Thorarchaeota archaeon]
MQNYSGLIWLLIPFIFLVLVALMFIRPRSTESDTKKGFYVVIVIGLIIVVGYWIIRIFILPP